jgi:SAM-dependent methyltransferase
MYTSFALIYDTLMQNVPYAEWRDRIDRWITAYGISQKNTASADNDEKNLVVDLGCGTGIMTEMLAELGYDMIGLDLSPPMLTVAMEKKAQNGSQTLYLNHDMRKMELYSTAGTFICICDSLNYLLAEEEVLATFKLVANYLYPGGIFIFDFDTVYKYAAVMGNRTIAESQEDCALIWDNYYHRSERLNEYDLTFFIKEADGRYRKHQETHIQRGYELAQIKRLLDLAGLEFVLAVDNHQEAEPNERSEKIFVVARKAGP